MKKFLLLFGSTLLLSAVGSAAILGPCPVSDYGFYSTTYSPASGNGCSILTSQFTSFVFANPGTPTVTAANITVNPVSVPNVGFQFGLPLNTGAGSGVLMDVTLSYNATAPSNNPFTGALLSQVGGFAGTGNATIKDAFCLGSFAAACAGGTQLNSQTQQNVIVGLNGQSTASTPFAPATTTVAVTKDISVATGTNGAASLTQATNVLTQANVPEPVSLLLMGSGLLALGVIGRRSRKA